MQVGRVVDFLLLLLLFIILFATRFVAFFYHIGGTAAVVSGRKRTRTGNHRFVNGTVCCTRRVDQHCGRHRMGLVYVRKSTLDPSCMNFSELILF